MGVLSTLFGGSKIIEKGMDIIGKQFPGDAEMLEAQTKAKTDLLSSYAPFKVAQRYLALLFGLTFVGSYLMVLGLHFFDQEMKDVLEILGTFKIDWIMLTIVGFYFGGGAFEGVVGKVNERKAKPG